MLADAFQMFRRIGKHFLRKDLQTCQRHAPPPEAKALQPDTYGRERRGQGSSWLVCVLSGNGNGGRHLTTVTFQPYVGVCLLNTVERSLAPFIILLAEGTHDDTMPSRARYFLYTLSFFVLVCHITLTSQLSLQESIAQRVSEQSVDIKVWHSPLPTPPGTSLGYLSRTRFGITTARERSSFSFCSRFRLVRDARRRRRQQVRAFYRDSNRRPGRWCRSLNQQCLRRMCPGALV